MQAFKTAEASLNAQYGSSIMTEFPFNGLGILEKVTWLSRLGVYGRPSQESRQRCIIITGKQLKAVHRKKQMKGDDRVRVRVCDIYRYSIRGSLFKEVYTSPEH